MSQHLTEQQVEHVARLSRLKLNDQQRHYFAEQLSHVLAHMDKLNQLQLDDVQPMAHPTDMTNRFREDTPGRPLSVEQVLANAPQADTPFFKVPKVLGEGSGA